MDSITDMTDMTINLLFETQNLKVKCEGQQKILIVIVNLCAKYHILMMKYCLKIYNLPRIKKEFALNNLIHFR